MARIVAPRLRETNSNSARIAATLAATHKIWALTRGANAIPKFTIALLLPEPLKQRGHVHLVGFVVAGERVHHNVDAGAECELALARFTIDHRQHRLAVGTCRPGTGKIVRGNDDRRHAVAAARRPAKAFFVFSRRKRLDPKLTGIKAAREVAQQIKRLGENVIARHR